MIVRLIYVAEDKKEDLVIDSRSCTVRQLKQMILAGPFLREKAAHIDHLRLLAAGRELEDSHNLASDLGPTPPTIHVVAVATGNRKPTEDKLPCSNWCSLS